MRFTDYMLVIPDIPLMIIAAALFGPNLVNIIVIIGIIYWTSTARLIRAQVMTVRERVYVKRAKALGAGNRRLVFKHVPAPGGAASRRQYGADDRPRNLRRDVHHVPRSRRPEHDLLGRLIENAFTGEATINNAWWAIVPPGVCVTLVILACTMVGQSVEDSLNPRLRVGHVSVRRFRMRPPAAGGSE